MPIRPFCIAWTFLAVTCAIGEDWPGWRGPRGDGTSLETDVPTQWDGKSGKNIRWKTAVPGTGYSSPVIIDRRIFLTSCDAKKQMRLLLCLDRDSGKVLWSREVLKSPLEGVHKLNGHASGTPATDGKNVVVTFFQTQDTSGERGRPGRMIVANYDFDGNQLWSVDVGGFSSIHGYCTSPVLYKDLVLLNGDHDGESYLAALNIKDGTEVWKTHREHKTRSYVTPLIRKIDGKTQAVLSGSKRVAAFDPDSGTRLWWVEGPTEQFVASMVYDQQNFYLTAGFPTHHVMAIRPDGKDDVTESHVAWHVQDAKSYVPSPVCAAGLLFVADDRGIGHCFDVQNGDHVWRKRLGRHYSASLVTANNLVYFTSDDGATVILKAAREPDVVETNELGESVFASPAISGGELFIRGTQHLFCIDQ